MITETVLSTTITALFAFAGVVVSNNASNKKNSIEQARRDQKIEDKIQALTERVDAHNGMCDKITNMEKSIIKIETRLNNK